jgi:hypothetical protein
MIYNILMNLYEIMVESFYTGKKILIVLLTPKLLLHMYKSLGLALFLLSQLIVNAQEQPLGYIKYFEADLSKKQNHQFITTSQTVSKTDKGIMYCESKTDSVIRFTPSAVLLVDDFIFGDFIAQTKVKITANDSDSLSGFYIVTGLRDSTNYYFLQLTIRGAWLYKMYKGEISLIQSDSSFILKDNEWQNLRINRSILTRTIQVKNNGTLIEFNDPNLVMGYIGVGVCDYKLQLNKLSVWAPTAISQPTGIFKEQCE